MSPEFILVRVLSIIELSSSVVAYTVPPGTPLRTRHLLSTKGRSLMQGYSPSLDIVLMQLLVNTGIHFP
jgi:hypothetical protein